MKKFIYILSVILISTGNMYSQTGWFQQNSGTAQGFECVYFLNDQTGFAGGGFKVYKTTNGGTSWTEKILPDTTNITSIRFLNSTTGFISSGISINSNWSRQFLYKTTNAGNNWIKIFGSEGTLTNESFNDVFPVDTMVYLTKGGWAMYGTTGSTFISQNSGANFSSINITSWEILQKISFINSQTGWINTSYGDDVGQSKRRIFKTTNHGLNWTMQYLDSATNSPLSNIKFSMQFVDQNTGFVLYPFGYLNNAKFIKTTNGGTNWVSATLPYSKSNALFFSDASTGWIGGAWYSDSVMIIRTTNGGANWLSQKKGDNLIYSIYFVNNLTGWAVGNNGLILKTVTGGVTGVQNVSSEVPSTYSLSQNYPNPFNPTTKIKFSIMSSPHCLGGDLVLLKVFDITGREIQTLVNEALQPGTYEVSFDGSGLNSGVYFYRLVTDGFTETKKMFMIK